jgi:hypothetical protein
MMIGTDCSPAPSALDRIRTGDTRFRSSISGAPRHAVAEDARAQRAAGNRGCAQSLMSEVDVSESRFQRQAVLGRRLHVGCHHRVPGESGTPRSPRTCLLDHERSQMRSAAAVTVPR